MTHAFPEQSGGLPFDPQGLFFDQQRERPQDQPASEAATSYATVEQFQAVYTRERQNYQVVTDVVGELPGRQDTDEGKLQLYGLVLPAANIEAAAGTARTMQTLMLWLGEQRREKPFFIIGQQEQAKAKTTELLLCAPNTTHNTGDNPVQRVTVWTDEFTICQKAVQLAQFKAYAPGQLQAMYDPASTTLRLEPGPNTMRPRTIDHQLQRPLLRRDIASHVLQKGLSIARGESLENRVSDQLMGGFGVIESLKKLVFALREERTDIYDYLTDIQYDQ